MMVRVSDNEADAQSLLERALFLQGELLDFLKLKKEKAGDCTKVLDLESLMKNLLHL